MMVVSWPVLPRIGWIGTDGRFLGWSVSFSTKARAAYVVFTSDGWKEIKA